MARRLLVADDEDMLRAVLVDMLMDAGFSVIEANDGLEALQLIKLDPSVELLISDIVMPRMDGHSLVQAALQYRPELKVIVMTGYSAEGLDRLRQIGIEVFHKPFNLDDLCQRASSMLS